MCELEKARKWFRAILVSLKNNTRLILAASLLIAPFNVTAQNDFTRVYGKFDHDVVVPKATNILGVRDRQALSEIAAHLKAVGHSSWNGLYGNGEIQYPGADGELGTPHPATLNIWKARGYRLDIETDQGLRSIRILGSAGAIQEPDGSKTFIPEATSVQGLTAFSLLRRDDFFRGQTSVSDHGSVLIDGRPLHRITVEYIIHRDRVTPDKKTPTSLALVPTTAVVDFYFDPQSHLLIKSVDTVTLPKSTNQAYLRCITYADYREVDGVLVPFQLSESLNGQQEWVLQLNDVKLSTSLRAVDFHF